MKFLFRCDSSYKIGSGHLTRCLNLAKCLDGEVHFICRKLPGNLNSRVVENQFQLIQLNSQDIEIQKAIEETEEVSAVFAEIQPDVIIVDHYGLDKSWEANASSYSKKVLAIDDLGREHLSDAILDQNFRNHLPSTYLANNIQLFTGPEFCLLNNSFFTAKPPKRNFEQVSSIMVFFGGADNHSLTMKTLQITSHFSKGVTWNFVAGAQNRDLAEMKLFADKHTNINLHVNIGYMAELMKNNDMFFGAAGSTSWERAKLGLPSLCISVADNQIDLAKNLDSQGACKYLGHYSELSEDSLTAGIKTFINSKVAREHSHKQGLKLNVGEKLNEVIAYLNIDT